MITTRRQVINRTLATGGVHLYYTSHTKHNVSFIFNSKDCGCWACHTIDNEQPSLCSMQYSPRQF